MMREPRRRSAESSRRRRRERRQSREDLASMYSNSPRMPGGYAESPRQQQPQPQSLPPQPQPQPQQPLPLQYQYQPPPQPPHPPQQQHHNPHNPHHNHHNNHNHQQMTDHRPRASSSSLSSSSSSSSSYLDISRKYPIQRFGGILSTFIKAPSEVRRRRRRRGSGSNSSTSSINSDMAYGTGFIRKEKVKYHSSSPASGHGSAPVPGPSTAPVVPQYRGVIPSGASPGLIEAPKDKTDEEILEIGRQLSDLARRSNEEDLRATGKGKASMFGATAAAMMALRKSRKDARSRGATNSKGKNSHGSSDSDDSDWEDASSDDDSSSSSGSSSDDANSNLAYGDNSQALVPVMSGAIAGAIAGSSVGSAVGSAPARSHHRRKSSVVHPDLFGPINSLRGLVNTPCGFGDDEQSPAANMPTRRAHPVPTDPSRFDADQSSIAGSRYDYQRSRPGSVPIEQPVPKLPVSSRVYQTDKLDNVGRRDSRNRRRQTDEKSIDPSFAGVAAAAAAAAARMSDRRGPWTEDRIYRDTVKRGRDNLDDERDAMDEQNRDPYADVDRYRPNMDSYYSKHVEKDESEPEITRQVPDYYGKDNSYLPRDERTWMELDPEERRETLRYNTSRAAPKEPRATKAGYNVGESDQPFQRATIDPFQYQVADDAFNTPQFNTPRPLTPQVVTIDRVPNFDDTPPRPSPPDMRLSRKDSFEIEREVEERRKASGSKRPHASHEYEEREREARSILDEAKHATIPVAAAAVASAIAVEREHQRRDRMTDGGARNWNEPPKDAVQEEADRHYRETVVARKIAADIARSGSQSPEESVLDKWEKVPADESFTIVTPPEEEERNHEKSLYDGPNADVIIDNHIYPHEIHKFLTPEGAVEAPAFKSQDPSCERERPVLNLVRPTPVPSPVHTASSEGQERQEAGGSREVPRSSEPHDDVILGPRGEVVHSGSNSKSVTWGENSTKSYEVESPEASSRAESPNGQAEAEEKPRPRLSKTSPWGNIAAAFASNSSEPTNELDQSVPLESRSRDIVAGDTDQVLADDSISAPPVGPKPASPMPEQMPGGYADDIEFAATLAAGLEDTGFNPDIVIDNPTYRRRNSAPGANDATGDPFIPDAINATPRKQPVGRSAPETPNRRQDENLEASDSPSRGGGKDKKKLRQERQEKLERLERLEKYLQMRQSGQIKPPPRVDSPDVQIPDAPRTPPPQESKKERRDRLEKFLQRRQSGDIAPPPMAQAPSASPSLATASPSFVKSPETADENQERRERLEKFLQMRQSGEIQQPPMMEPEQPQATVPEPMLPHESEKIVQDSAPAKKSKKKKRRSRQFDDGELSTLSSQFDEESTLAARPDDEGSRLSAPGDHDSEWDEWDSSPSSLRKIAPSDLSVRSSRSNRSKRRGGAGYDYGENGHDPPDPPDGRGVNSVVSEPRSKDASSRYHDDDDTKSTLSRSSRKSKDSGKKSGGFLSGFFKSNGNDEKRDSFLGNAGTLGAGAGPASEAVASASALTRLNAADISSEKEPVSSERPGLSREFEDVDPEIAPRAIKPAIDPEFRDLLPLPPSEPGSPREIPGELPGLPNSRPGTPPEERHLRYERTHRRQQSSHDTTVRTHPKTHSKSFSNTAIPIALRMGRGSNPSSPIGPKPTFGSPRGVVTPESITRRSARPTSWDSGGGIMPLMLLEHTRHGSMDRNIKSEELPPLPPSEAPSETESPGQSPAQKFEDFRTSILGPSDSFSLTSPLQIQTDIPLASWTAADVESEAATPKADVKPELPVVSTTDDVIDHTARRLRLSLPQLLEAGVEVSNDDEPDQFDYSMSKKRSSFLLNSTPSSGQSNRTIDAEAVQSPATPTHPRIAEVLRDSNEDLTSADEHFSDALETARQSPADTPTEDVSLNQALSRDVASALVAPPAIKQTREEISEVKPVEIPDVASIGTAVETLPVGNSARIQDESTNPPAVSQEVAEEPKKGKKNKKKKKKSISLDLSAEATPSAEHSTDATEAAPAEATEQVDTSATPREPEPVISSADVIAEEVLAPAKDKSLESVAVSESAPVDKPREAVVDNTAREVKSTMETESVPEIPRDIGLEVPEEQDKAGPSTKKSKTRKLSKGKVTLVAEEERILEPKSDDPSAAVPEPVPEPSNEVAIGPTTEDILEPILEPVTEITPEISSESALKSAAELIPEPVNESTAEARPLSEAEPITVDEPRDFLPNESDSKRDLPTVTDAIPIAEEEVVAAAEDVPTVATVSKKSKKKKKKGKGVATEDSVSVAALEPTPEPASEPAAESTAGPISGPIPEPTVEDAKELVSEPLMQQMEEVTKEPVQSGPESRSELVSDVVPEITPESTVKSILDPVAEPLVESVSVSTPEFSAEPSTERVSEPVVEPTTEPIFEPVPEPTGESLVEPLLESVSETMPEHTPNEEGAQETLTTPKKDKKRKKKKAKTSVSELHHKATATQSTEPESTKVEETRNLAQDGVLDATELDPVDPDFALLQWAADSSAESSTPVETEEATPASTDSKKDKKKKKKESLQPEEDTTTTAKESDPIALEKESCALVTTEPEQSSGPIDPTTQPTEPQLPVTSVAEQGAIANEELSDIVEELLPVVTEEPVQEPVSEPVPAPIEESIPTVVEEPISVAIDEPNPTTLEEPNAATVEEPLNTVQEPVTTVDKSIALAIEESSGAAVEKSVTTIEESVNTIEDHDAIAEESIPATVEEPVTTVEEPVTTLEESAAPAIRELSNVTVEQPVTTVEDLSKVTAEEPVPATMETDQTDPVPTSKSKKKKKDKKKSTQLEPPEEISFSPASSNEGSNTSPAQGQNNPDQQDTVVANNVEDHAKQAEPEKSNVADATSDAQQQLKVDDEQLGPHAEAPAIESMEGAERYMNQPPPLKPYISEPLFSQGDDVSEHTTQDIPSSETTQADESFVCVENTPHWISDEPTEATVTEPAVAEVEKGLIEAPTSTPRTEESSNMDEFPCAANDQPPQDETDSTNALPVETGKKSKKKRKKKNSVSFDINEPEQNPDAEPKPHELAEPSTEADATVIPVVEDSPNTPATVTASELPESEDKQAPTDDAIGVGVDLGAESGEAPTEAPNPAPGESASLLKPEQSEGVIPTLTQEDLESDETTAQNEAVVNEEPTGSQAVEGDRTVDDQTSENITAPLLQEPELALPVKMSKKEKKKKKKKQAALEESQEAGVEQKTSVTEPATSALDSSNLAAQVLENFTATEGQHMHYNDPLITGNTSHSASLQEHIIPDATITEQPSGSSQEPEASQEPEVSQELEVSPPNDQGGSSPEMPEDKKNASAEDLHSVPFPLEPEVESNSNEEVEAEMNLEPLLSDLGKDTTWDDLQRSTTTAQPDVSLGTGSSQDSETAPKREQESETKEADDAWGFEFSNEEEKTDKVLQVEPAEALKAAEEPAPFQDSVLTSELESTKAAEDTLVTAPSKKDKKKKKKSKRPSQVEQSSEQNVIPQEPVVSQENPEAGDLNQDAIPDTDKATDAKTEGLDLRPSEPSLAPQETQDANVDIGQSPSPQTSTEELAGDFGMVAQPNDAKGEKQDSHANPAVLAPETYVHPETVISSSDAVAESNESTRPVEGSGETMVTTPSEPVDIVDFIPSEEADKMVPTVEDVEIPKADVTEEALGQDSTVSEPQIDSAVVETEALSNDQLNNATDNIRSDDAPPPELQTQETEAVEAVSEKKLSKKDKKKKKKKQQQQLQASLAEDSAGQVSNDVPTAEPESQPESKLEESFQAEPERQYDSTTEESTIQPQEIVENSPPSQETPQSVDELTPKKMTRKEKKKAQKLAARVAAALADSEPTESSQSSPKDEPREALGVETLEEQHDVTLMEDTAQDIPPVQLGIPLVESEPAAPEMTDRSLPVLDTPIQEKAEAVAEPMDLDLNIAPVSEPQTVTESPALESETTASDTTEHAVTESASLTETAPPAEEDEVVPPVKKNGKKEKKGNSGLMTPAHEPESAAPAESAESAEAVSNAPMDESLAPVLASDIVEPEVIKEAESADTRPSEVEEPNPAPLDESKPIESEEPQHPEPMQIAPSEPTVPSNSVKDDDSLAPRAKKKNKKGKKAKAESGSTIPSEVDDSKPSVSEELSRQPEQLMADEQIGDIPEPEPTAATEELEVSNPAEDVGELALSDNQKKSKEAKIQAASELDESESLLSERENVESVARDEPGSDVVPEEKMAETTEETKAAEPIVPLHDNGPAPENTTTTADETPLADILPIQDASASQPEPTVPESLNESNTAAPVSADEDDPWGAFTTGWAKSNDNKRKSNQAAPPELVAPDSGMKSDSDATASEQNLESGSQVEKPGERNFFGAALGGFSLLGRFGGGKKTKDKPPPNTTEKEQPKEDSFLGRQALRQSGDEKSLRSLQTQSSINIDFLDKKSYENVEGSRDMDTTPASETVMEVERGQKEPAGHAARLDEDVMESPILGRGDMALIRPASTELSGPLETGLLRRDSGVEEPIGGLLQEATEVPLLSPMDYESEFANFRRTPSGSLPAVQEVPEAEAEATFQEANRDSGFGGDSPNPLQRQINMFPEQDQHRDSGVHTGDWVEATMAQLKTPEPRPESRQEWRPRRSPLSTPFSPPRLWPASREVTPDPEKKTIPGTRERVLTGTGTRPETPTGRTSPKKSYGSLTGPGPSRLTSSATAPTVSLAARASTPPTLRRASTPSSLRSPTPPLSRRTTPSPPPGTSSNRSRRQQQRQAALRSAIKSESQSEPEPQEPSRGLSDGHAQAISGRQSPATLGRAEAVDPSSRPDAGVAQRSASNSSLSRKRSPPEPLKPVRPSQPESPGTARPGSTPPTPPLRRTDGRRVSGDLRALRQQNNGASSSDNNNNSSNSNSNPIVSTTPIANEGRVRSKDMPDVYDGYGEGRIGSPLSPTRPASMRRRQSMQVIELEAKVEQLTAENRQLSHARTSAEHHLNHRAVTALSERDAQIDALKQNLKFLQNEVARLAEVNDGLAGANAELAHKDNSRYADLQVHSREDPHSNQEAALKQTIQEKDAEIADLRAQLDDAKDQIRKLQRQILESKAADAQFLNIKDEDYFDHRCQQLCSHVQQWVLRFSKFSDMRACRLTSEINDEKIIDRLDNAILDGSDVDRYLNDRVRRRDVFMSVTMNMIWEFVFTRYLFGMDREQRQKLKSLERVLTDVGPPHAVRQWRAVTLTLLSKRDSFRRQRELDTEAVVQAIYQTLCKVLPPPSNLEAQIQSQLRRVMHEAVQLSIEMRMQKAEYMMLPPLQPEYDADGELVQTVQFNASMMNERSGSLHMTNEELEAQGAIVRTVLFPLVVKKGDDDGMNDEEIVVCPAQVLIARSKLTRQPTPSSDGGRVSGLAAPGRMSGGSSPEANK